jgi:AcrR family transcriptional regulator
MASERRRGVESSKSRALLVDAAAQILRDEGFVAVSARRVAERAGLKPQLVHYYFETMDDLLLAVVRQVNARRRDRHEQAMASSQPLRAMWEMSADPSAAALGAEVTALAIHRPAVRAEVVRSAEEFRRIQAEAVASLFERYGVDRKAYPPAGVALLMSGVARALVAEVAVGMIGGQAEARAIVERLLHAVEPVTAAGRAT